MTEGPLHGYRGATEPKPPRPTGPVVALSREAGARGGSIARRVGRQLGWAVYTQDTLDYLVRDDTAREELLTGLPAGAAAWADFQTARLTAAGLLVAGTETAATARLLLAVAARGEAVVVGRAAGYILPAATTLHVRIVAPAAERVRYIADWLRLPPEEAAEEVRVRDRRRDRIAAAFVPGGEPGVTAFDLVLNSSRMGEAGCVAVIAAAVKQKYPSDDSSAEFLLDPA